MATQSPPRPTASEAAQASAQVCPSVDPGAVQGAAAARAGEPGSGTTNLVANALRTGDGPAGNTFGSGTDYEVLRLSAPLERLPVGLVVSVPVREFRVRHLLAMAPGALIETQWGHGEDLPLSSGDVQLAWSEFEVVDARLAVRVTRLS